MFSHRSSSNNPISLSRQTPRGLRRASSIPVQPKSAEMLNPHLSVPDALPVVPVEAAMNGNTVLVVNVAILAQPRPAVLDAFAEGFLLGAGLARLNDAIHKLVLVGAADETARLWIPG